MKRLIIILAALLLVFTLPLAATNPTKTQKRVAYTLKNLKISTREQALLKPILESYLKDKKIATKKYDDLKDKYKKTIDGHVLTDDVARTILAAKWECETKELEVKKSYAKKFATIISAKKVYYCFTLLNDKMSKIEGRKTKSSDNED